MIKSRFFAAPQLCDAPSTEPNRRFRRHARIYKDP
jgi:hypothetical protein